METILNEVPNSAGKIEILIIDVGKWYKKVGFQLEVILINRLDDP